MRPVRRISGCVMMLFRAAVEKPSKQKPRKLVYVTSNSTARALHCHHLNPDGHIS